MPFLLSQGSVAAAQEPTYPVLGAAGEITREEVLASHPLEGGGMSNYEPLESTKDGQGRTVYVIDGFSNPQWSYQINAEYKLEPGYLAEGSHSMVETRTDGNGETETFRSLLYRLPDGFDIRGLVPDREYALTDTAGRPMGHYRLYQGEQGTGLKISFNEATVERNATQTVEGWTSVTISLDDELRRKDVQVDLGNGAILDIKRFYDVQIAKTAGNVTISEDGSIRSRTYTIVVSTKDGTPGPVNLTDAMVNAVAAGGLTLSGAHADGSDMEVSWLARTENTVTGDDGEARTEVSWEPLAGSPAWSEDGTTLGAWLPQLQEGESITITYEAKDAMPLGTSDALTNTAVAQYTHEGTTIRAEATTKEWVDNDPRHSQYKTAVNLTATGDGEEETISWKVTLNGNHANLRSWTWKDLPGEGLAQPTNILICPQGAADSECVTVPDAAGGEVPSYRFSEERDDYREYVITYDTKVTEWHASYGNQSQLCLEQECDTSGTATWKRPSAFDKRGVLLDQKAVTAQDGTTEHRATLHWSIVVGTQGGFPLDPKATEWKVTDAFAQSEGHWRQVMTPAQQQALGEHIEDAIRKLVGESEEEHSATTGELVTAVTFTKAEGEQDATGFTVSSNKRIPKGLLATITYETTVIFEDGNTSWTDIGNCVADDHGDRQCPSVHIPPYADEDAKPGSGALSVGKRDTGRKGNQGETDQGQKVGGHYDTTTHQYDGLRTSRTTDPATGETVELPYLEWTIDVVPDLSQTDQDLVVTEQLPEHTRLLTGRTATVDANRTATDDVAGLVVNLPYWTSGVSPVVVPGEKTAFYLEWPAWNRSEQVDYATAAVDSEDSRTVVITIPAAFLEKHRQHIEGQQWRQQRLSIVVRVTPTDILDVVGQEQVTVYGNTVIATQGEARDEASQQQTVKRDTGKYSGKEVLNKVSQYKKELGLVATRNAAVYQLDVNAGGLCVPGSDASGESCPQTVAFQDTMTYGHEVGYDDSEFVLDPDSVHVYRDAVCQATNAQGGCTQWEPGAQTITRVKHELYEHSEWVVDDQTTWQGHNEDRVDYRAVIEYCPKNGTSTGTDECRPVGWTPSGDDAKNWDPVPVMEDAVVVELDKAASADQVGADSYWYDVTSSKPTGEDAYVREYLTEVPPKYGYIWSNRLDFVVPNETHLIIDYQYKGFGNPQAWVGASNTMTFAGRNYAPTDESFAVNLATATAGAQVSGLYLEVRKIDATDGSKRLAGAKFKLEAWKCPAEPGEDVPDCWQAVENPNGTGEEKGKGIWTTDEYGLIALTDQVTRDDRTYEILRYNRAYRLTEVEAPEGYAIGDAAQSTKTFYIGKIKPNTDMVADENYPWQCPMAQGKNGAWVRQCGDSVANGAFIWIVNPPAVVMLPQAGGSGNATSLVALGVAVVLLGFAAALRARRLSFQTSSV